MRKLPTTTTVITPTITNSIKSSFKKYYRFNFDSNNKLPGSDNARSRFFLKIPRTFKNAMIFLETLSIQMTPDYLDTMPGIQVRSSSFGTNEYSDSSDYGILASIENSQLKRNATNNRFFYVQKINKNDIGYITNNLINLNNLDITLTEDNGTVLNSNFIERVKYGFLIVSETVEI